MFEGVDRKCLGNGRPRPWMPWMVSFTVDPDRKWIIYGRPLPRVDRKWIIHGPPRQLLQNQRSTPGPKWKIRHYKQPGRSKAEQELYCTGGENFGSLEHKVTFFIIIILLCKDVYILYFFSRTARTCRTSTTPDIDMPQALGTHNVDDTYCPENNF